MAECMGIPIMKIIEDINSESLTLIELQESLGALNELNTGLMYMGNKPIDYKDSPFTWLLPDVVAGDSYFFNIMDNWYVTQQVNGMFSQLVKVTNEQIISIINMMK